MPHSATNRPAGWPQHLPRELFCVFETVRRFEQHARGTSRNPQGPLIVGFSGGPDSTALLAGAVLAAAAAQVPPPVPVIINHQIQPAAAEMTAHAQLLARALGTEPVTVVVQVDPTPQAGGTEAAARTARRAALTQEWEHIGGCAVALGHTQADQAETVLLALARGSGTRSLSGIAPQREQWWRPLLGLEREVVHAAARQAGALRTPAGQPLLQPWQDVHNEDPQFRRVRVRHELMPLLQDILGSGIVANLARSAQLLRSDADELDHQASQALVQLLSLAPPDSAGELAVPVSQWLVLPEPIRYRILRMVAIRAGAPAGSLGWRHIVQIANLAEQWHGQGPVSLPGRVTVRRMQGWLIFQ